MVRHDRVAHGDVARQTLGVALLAPVLEADGELLLQGERTRGQR